MNEFDSPKMHFMQSAKLLFLYSLPVMLVLAVMLASYYERTYRVANEINKQEQLVKKAMSSIADSGSNEINYKTVLLSHPEIAERISRMKNLGDDVTKSNSDAVLSFYVDYYGQGRVKTDFDIYETINYIWISNSSIILIMTLFPYYMLGGRFAFSRSLNATYKERLETVHSGFWMKLIVAIVVTYGWLYLLNPAGRGGSTFEQFLITVDFSQPDTLPMFLRHTGISPVIAAFLGWYLYMLTYFFTKMTTNDVVSSQAYGTLLQKFLFTWGITIVFVATEVSENANLIAFLIGFFPMAAFSLIKDKGMSIIQGGNKDEGGQLVELPGISRWQILRLEEEGINSMGSLAYHPRRNINQYLPGMAKLVDYWSDIAKLYTLVGPQKYMIMQPVCLTASEFVLKSKDMEFVQALDDVGVKNPQEIARQLLKTFPELNDVL